jgi:hypothetical protein
MDVERSSLDCIELSCPFEAFLFEARCFSEDLKQGFLDHDSGSGGCFWE